MNSFVVRSVWSIRHACHLAFRSFYDCDLDVKMIAESYLKGGKLDGFKNVGSCQHVTQAPEACIGHAGHSDAPGGYSL